MGTRAKGAPCLEQSSVSGADLRPILLPAVKSFAVTANAEFPYIQLPGMSQGAVWLQYSDVCKPISVLSANYVCLKMLNVVVPREKKTQQQK